MTWEVIALHRAVHEHRRMKPLLLIVLAAFGALTAAAVWVHGIVGLFEPLLTTLAGGQVLADLVIALSLFLVWMWRDATRLNRNPWPWLVLTLAAGSFGPLLYLLTRRADEPVLGPAAAVRGEGRRG
jgi:Terpene cyclase DEP1